MPRRDEMDRMMSARRLQFRTFMWVMVGIQVLGVIGAVWLLTHPEIIGGFFGRVVAGAVEAKSHG